MTRKDKRTICLLGLVCIALVLLLTSNVFGNTIDWYSQHVVIADALRHAIRSEGTLFPTYMKQLMGGGNIYHFSYYGYLRPDILIGALLIKVNMQTIIIAYSVLMMTLSVICCYIFLRQHTDDENICIFVSLLVLLSSIFFHSHKQIMFVNYMPYLFLALISIEKKNFVAFTLCGSMIVLHSYFYCIGCFIVCFIYLLYRYPQEWKKLFISYVLIVLLTAILTIPTLYIILMNGKSGAPTQLSSLFIPSLNLKGLLYSKYGCGLTYISYILLVLALGDKQLRKLSIVTLVSFYCPLVWFIMNGFLYARSKIMLVFIPIVAYIMCMMLVKIKEGDVKLSKYAVILLIIPLFFIDYPVSALIDCLFASLLLLQKRKQVLYAYLVVPMLVVSFINCPSSFYKPKKSEKNVSQLVRRNKMHTVADLTTRQNVNQTHGNILKRVSGYTSTNNKHYNEFLFDTLRIPIPTNNRVAQNDTDNIFYLKTLGIDTVISERNAPYGYSLKDQDKNVKLYQSNTALPQAYATSELMSEKQFKKLSYPYTLDTLVNCAIVNKGNTHYQSQFVEENPGFEKKYHIKNKVNKEITLKRQTNNEIVVLECDVVNKKPLKGISMSVNGMKNKLASITNPYYHPHTHFTFVTTSNQLKVTLSKGNYIIKNIKMHTLPASALHQQVDPLETKKTSHVLEGKINVSKDGYFITRIPYEKGYTMYIDNKKVNAEKVNQAFLGCHISKGTHQIKITFTPPGYTLACIISTIGVILLALFYIYQRKYDTMCEEG
ncbi:YfhO family protein [uncultured Catenibacterium sp.]|uniref:YfhO family protein n=1 Tax=uncultured Catenibacterium sp. TaxID=286142 RepID=UPI0025F35147|nr:YfhO family protein [uncultured Catenibacterium sp.]